MKILLSNKLKAEAESELKRNNLKVAKKKCKEALNIQPRNPDFIILMGLIESQSNNFIKAINHFEKALEHGAYSESLYNNIGICYAKISELKKAEEAFKKSLNINPKFIQSYLNYSQFLIVQHKFDIAETLLNQGIELVPSDPDLYFRLGNIQFHTNRKQEARNNYLKVLDLEPRHSGALYAMQNYNFESN